MGWAASYIIKLKAGETVRFTAYGRSMSGRIESGNLVTVEPIPSYESLTIDDIVLCKVNGREYLHLVKSIGVGHKTFIIGNNQGHINGLIRRPSIFGICTHIES